MCKPEAILSELPQLSAVAVTLTFLSEDSLSDDSQENVGTNSISRLLQIEFIGYIS